MAEEKKETPEVKPPSKKASSRVSCYGCGVMVDLEAVHPSPHRSCPVCKAPLDADAVEHQAHHADNPSDSRDQNRAKLKRQALADVRSVNPGTSVTQVQD